MMNQQELERRVRDWLESPAIKDGDKHEIRQLAAAKEWEELSDRFYRDLEFGTGGMRGVMGDGRNRLNAYNISRAVTALGEYLAQAFPGTSPLRVAISYDSRHNSQAFARVAAEALAGMHIQTCITEHLRPVPMLSFMVRELGCQAGICLTASHNPPKYNGFKVYLDDGGQVVPPHDTAIGDRYLLADPAAYLPVPFEDGVRRGLVQVVTEDFDAKYIRRVQSLSLNPETRPPLRIIYSPLHGAGRDPMLKALHAFGFRDVRLVEEQATPDGDFPTVKSPNPEDPEALAMGIGKLKREEGDILIATDPDCDRLAIVARNADGSADAFNGNEMGCLLVDYVLGSRHAAGTLPPGATVIKTIVTTDLQSDIARHYGCRIEETLTGFKWIAARILAFEGMPTAERFHYVCGGEESYGFLAGDFVRDKDAIIAGALACEMAAFHKAQGRTLRQALDAIHRRHGFYLDHLITETLEGQAGAEKINRTMEKLRRQPPMEIADIKVNSMKDFKTGQATAREGDQFLAAGTLTLPPSNVIQLTLEDGSRISARPSGTEPKIKFYFSIRQDADGIELPQARRKAQEKLERFTGVIRSYLL